MIHNFQNIDPNAKVCIIEIEEGAGKTKNMSHGHWRANSGNVQQIPRNSEMDSKMRFLKKRKMATQNIVVHSDLHFGSVDHRQLAASPAFFESVNKQYTKILHADTIERKEKHKRNQRRRRKAKANKK